MIEVKTNENIIFFFFLFNILSKTKEIHHPLGKSLMKRFPNLPKEVGKLEKFYEKGEIPRHPYQYCTLAINTDSDLKAKKLNPNYGYGRKTLQDYSEKMYPLVLKIEKDLDFFNIFSKEFLPKYKELCQKNQKHLGKNVYSELKSFWELEKEIELFLISNILASGGSYGLFRKKTMYSITSPVLIKKNVRDFTPANLISNSIHEFSHSIFKKRLIDLGEFENLKKKAREIEIPQDMLKRHQSPEIYFEETFVKTVTHFLLTNIYKPFMSSKESEEKEREILNKIKKDGYIHAPEFYAELKKGKDPIGVCLRF